MRISIRRNFQTAAYEMARREEDELDYGPRWILRFDKETAEFEAKPFPVEDLQKDSEAFLGARAARQRLIELRSRGEHHAHQSVPARAFG